MTTFMQFFGIQDIFIQWESIGVFDFLFPLLLVFAIVYGILVKVKPFGEANKPLYTLIAIVIGFMSLRFNLLGDFLAEVAPRLGVGVVILLIVLILIGMFISNNDWKVWGRILIGVGAIIGVIILHKTFTYLGWTGYSGGVVGDNVGFIILFVLIVGVIVAVVSAGGKDTTPHGGFSGMPER